MIAISTFGVSGAALANSCPVPGNNAILNCPNFPGAFYPYFTHASVGATCEWEFGQMANGDSFGGANQYGASSSWFFGTDASAVLDNPQTWFWVQ